MGGYGEKAYTVVREGLCEEVTGEQSPGNRPEGAELVKMGIEFFNTGNNRHEGPEVFTEQLLVSTYLARYCIYNGGQNGCKLPLSRNLLTP